MQTVEDQARLAEIGRRGEEMYERHIRPKLKPDDHGKFLVLNIETGDYEIGSDDYDVSKSMRDRYPADRLWLVRVGHAAAYKMGLRMKVIGS